ncbi:MAG: carboxypeptidase regulatory-like domain-containing protein, partial [Candidatus Sumerlaeota bacterium]
MTSRRFGRANGKIFVFILLLAVLAVGTLIYRTKASPDVAAAVSGAPALAKSVSPPTPEKNGAGTQRIVLGEIPTTMADVKAEAADPKEKEVFRGKVISLKTKQPIAGASVGIYDIVLSTTIMELSEAIAETKTDAEGKYELPAINSLNARMTVRSAAPGYATSFTYIFANKFKPKEDTLTIEMTDAGILAGKVVDVNGAGVEGASLATMQATPKYNYTPTDRSQSSPFAMTRSGVGGNFIFDDVAAGDSLRVSARKKGYTTTSKFPLEEGKRDVEIVMVTGGATIRGIVYQVDGRPAVGAAIFGSVLGGDGTSMESVTTDAEGKFTLEGLTAGMWNLNASTYTMKPPPINCAPNVDKQQQVERDGTVNVELKFPPPFKLKGRVVEENTEKGIAGVYLSTNYGPRGVSAEERTKALKDGRTGLSDGLGKFSIESAPYKSQQLFIDAPAGWVLQDNMYSMNMIQISDSQWSDGGDIIIKLKHGKTLRGKVVDKNNGPVVGANVTVKLGEQRALRNAASDTEGQFFVSYDESTGEATVSVTATDGWDEKKVALPAQGDPDPVTLQLQLYAAVSGTVTNADGEPVKDAGIVTAANEMMIPRYGGRNPTATYTNESGYYFRDHVAGGKGVIALIPPQGSQYSAPTSIPIDLAAGERKENQNFVLGEGEIIEGTVTNEESEPVVGASIQAYGGASGFSNIVTDDKGYFKIGGIIEAGSLQQMTVSHPEYDTQWRQNLSPMDGPQDFVMIKKKKQDMQAIDDRSGEPIAHYDYILGNMEIMMYPNQPMNHVDSPDGKTTLSISSNGSHVVTVSETDEAGNKTGRVGSGSFNPADAGKDVTIVRVGSGYSIAGQVIDAETRNAVGDVKVELQGERSYYGSGENFPSTTTNSTGRFELKGLTPGNFILVGKIDKRSGNKKIEIKSDDNIANPVDGSFEITSGTEITGTVLDPDGKPFPGVTINYYPNSRYQRTSVVTDADGKYKITGVTIDNWFLAASSMKGLEMDKSVKVDALTPRVQDFDFSGFITVTGKITMNGKPFSSRTESLVLQNIDGRNGGNLSFTVQLGQAALEPRLQVVGAAASFLRVETGARPASLFV